MRRCAGTETEELTFDKLHHLYVIRMCNKGPVNLENRDYIMMRINMINPMYLQLNVTFVFVWYSIKKAGKLTGQQVAAYSLCFNLGQENSDVSSLKTQRQMNTIPWWSCLLSEHLPA